MTDRSNLLNQLLMMPKGYEKRTCSICRGGSVTSMLITGEYSCLECSIPIFFIDSRRSEYEKAKGMKMKTNRLEKTFLTLKELQRFKDDPKYLVTYSEQELEPDEYTMRANIQEIVYIKDLADGKYFAAYLFDVIGREKRKRNRERRKREKQDSIR